LQAGELKIEANPRENLLKNDSWKADWEVIDNESVKLLRDRLLVPGPVASPERGRPDVRIRENHLRARSRRGS
jgi:hypothetical protein